MTVPTEETQSRIPPGEIIGYREYDHLVKEVHDIQQTIHKIDVEKQPRINQWWVFIGATAWFVPIVTFAFWFGTFSSHLQADVKLLTAQLVQLTKQQELNMGDRFRGVDAVRELSLRDQRMDYMQQSIEDIREIVKFHDEIHHTNGENNHK